MKKLTTQLSSVRTSSPADGKTCNPLQYISWFETGIVPVAPAEPTNAMPDAAITASASRHLLRMINLSASPPGSSARPELLPEPVACHRWHDRCTGGSQPHRPRDLTSRSAGPTGRRKRSQEPYFACAA